ncbi:hypothetical protein PR202_ga00715 [Eleusine coracana subsp. coracana]|uniref:Uncharacterized protein n=1 Tax=Eleusine coracana subsp. coracana TaxID=191504 RepID=A0AAV5BGD7_ELECO|nr:hypothetical protein PR202_ga00715 [Eleusine coracana subsp. coracana]
MSRFRRSALLLALPFLFLLLAQFSNVFNSPFLCPPLFSLSRKVPSLEVAESTPGTRTRKIGGGAASSVFSLFNLKSKSKFWTESVIRTEFDDLEGSASRDTSKKGLLNFTRAGCFSVHAIHMGEDVLSVLENAIKVLSRSEDLADSRDNEGFLQVDSAQMEHIFSTLVDHLQIQEAYNIFILNPKPIGKSVKYGYR